MNFDPDDSIAHAIQKVLGFFALVAFTLLLIFLCSCTCDPHLEYCGEPVPYVIARP